MSRVVAEKEIYGIGITEVGGDVVGENVGREVGW